MADTGRRDCLDRLGQMLVDARDATLDEVKCLLEEDAGDSIASFVRGCYRQGGPSKPELCDIIGYYLDHLMVELAYKVQDAEIVHGLTLRIECPSQTAIEIGRLSDGLAGEFMTEDGWFEWKSRHGRNRFEKHEL